MSVAAVAKAAKIRSTVKFINGSSGKLVTTMMKLNDKWVRSIKLQKSLK